MITAELSVPQPPEAAFDSLVRQLSDSLARAGMVLPWEQGGAITEHGTTIGRVAAWRRGSELALEWVPTPWASTDALSVRLTFEPVRTGCRIRCLVSGWEALLSRAGKEMSEWAGAAFVPSLLLPLSPTAVGDWITDVLARRPAGPQAIEVYRDPKFHWPNFLLILDRIHLTPADRLLEVGSGGGAFLLRAMESGCTATAIDHSPEMIRLATEVNRRAIDVGRLVILEGDAGRLPVRDGAFTCCVSTGAFGFFPDPPGALKEMLRALVPGGRLALFAGTPALRGTPAAPEPIASRVRFYEAGEIARLCTDAGFVDVKAEEPDLEPYAKRAGLPSDVVAFFHRTGGALLVSARKPGGK